MLIHDTMEGLSKVDAGTDHPADARGPAARTPADRRADALSLLADLVIKTYLADRCASAPQRFPSKNAGEIALPVRREDAVLSQPRSRSC
ncbi:MAG: hypothetical protein MUF54_18925 [Polyangiaceae bacterium]|jgi:hypothetical protein|nr:hypothetical protein [Polyangiaceae bacterium]